MKKNLKLIVFLVLGIIALYISTNYYNDFNRSKTIKACIIGKAELDSNKPESERLSADEVKKFCEDQIKWWKNQKDQMLIHLL